MEPEPVESTRAWQVAAEEYADEQGKAEVKEHGLLVEWRDASEARAIASDSR